MIYALLLALATGVIPEGGTPAAEIPFSIVPYVNVLTQYQLTYSGRYVVSGQQSGAYVVNVDGSTFKMLSAATKQSVNMQPAIYWFNCDICWQTVDFVAASPITPKWVVTTGIRHTGCPRPWNTSDNTCSAPTVMVGSVQVYRLDGTFRYIGQIDAKKVSELSGPAILDGDFAYFRERAPDTDKFTKVDLNALTVVAEDLGSAPARADQTAIDGYTYSLVPLPPTPIPNPYPGPQKFKLVRSGGAAPTATPLTTLIKTSTPTLNRTRTASKTPSSGVPCDTVPGGPICTTTPSAIPSRTRTVTRVATSLQTSVTPTASPTTPAPVRTATPNPTCPPQTITVVRPTMVPTPNPTPSPNAGWFTGCRSAK